METIKKLKNWDDFKNTVQILLKSSSNTGRAKALTFRGQSDCKWELKTTLDRSRTEPFDFLEYFRLVTAVQPEIETFTEHNWTIPEFNELKDYSSNYDSLSSRFPAYEYLVYLRHHGFPSPLLDWSASPYVAAFFAYSNETNAEEVAIYCFQEFVSGGKLSSSDNPQIKGLGPKVKSHKRHFLQQSQYTICAKFQNDSWSYRPHEEVFKLGVQGQDRLTKFILPASERHKVLRDLDVYNINAFSLFQNEESLLETLSIRELILRNE